LVNRSLLSQNSNLTGFQQEEGKMEVNDEVYAFMQAHLGYSDEELQIFKGNPMEIKVEEREGAAGQQSVAQGSAKPS
jgi:hypothetical protein